MMFTLSAPALAESTNALMQLSINSRSSIARLNEQNSIPEDAKTLNIADGDIEVSVSAESVQTATQGGQTYTGVFYLLLQVRVPQASWLSRAAAARLQKYT